MPTGNDLVQSALRKIQSIAPGETPTAMEAADSLEALNDMLDGWRIERLMVWSIPRLVFPLPRSPLYVGPGADIDIPRPAHVERYGVIVYTNAASQPLELVLQSVTVDEWARIPVKNVGSAIPQQIWDDDGFPWRKLEFWPTPMGNLGLAIYPWLMIDKFQDLSTNYEFPPGYVDAMKWNLAFRIATEFGNNVPPVVMTMSQESKAKIKSINHPVIDLRCDEAIVASGRRLYNWLSDSPAGHR